ncbi:unnamed protein product [Spirodela intermedia]|uniref:Uncharacterized protein n=1 Tax=Spirodela intermedia TaxID=51605 RepID=A0A7I8LA03_SPIIN|nr:unnamed protein product [Spirodela intermedia]
MAGSVSSSSARSLGVGRFYSPPHRRQHEHSQQQEKPQRLAKTRQKPAGPPELEAREVESRVDSDDSSSKPSMSASPSPPPTPPPPAGNLDRFLQSTTPLVPALYPPKINMRGRRNGETNDSHPYFNLGDLWESFREWSAYGAGVPVTLNGSDSVIQYYVPYLSGIQLYAESHRLRSRSRQPSEEIGADLYRYTSSGGSSSVEGAQHVTERISRVFLGENPNCAQEGSSSDGGDARNPPGALIFEYLERDPPYGREPLADKISLLASRFPELKTYKSCDLLPSSWMSVAWYPIYRIPTGPTLRDLDACFLTFHSLSTSPKDSSSHPDIGPGIYGSTHMSAAVVGRSPAKLSLPIFGLASYKFKGSIWTSNGTQERQQASSLLQAAESWLRQLQVDHPDFSFFLSHNGGPSRR